MIRRHSVAGASRSHRGVKRARSTSLAARRQSTDLAAPVDGMGMRRRPHAPGRRALAARADAFAGPGTGEAVSAPQAEPGRRCIVGRGPVAVRRPVASQERMRVSCVDHWSFSDGCLVDRRGPRNDRWTGPESSSPPARTRGSGSWKSRATHSGPMSPCGRKRPSPPGAAVIARSRSKAASSAAGFITSTRLSPASPARRI